jgi:hypothetical protein
MSLILQSSGGGQITIQEPATASNFTQTLPAATGTIMVSGNQPAFSATMSANQSVTNSVFSKVVMNTEDFDTASCYNNTGSTVGGIPAYAFLPNVAGYYQFSYGLNTNTGVTQINVVLFKNGAQARGVFANTASAVLQGSFGSSLVFMNGTTDYAELYGYLVGTTPTINNNTGYSYFQACLVRAA